MSKIIPLMVLVLHGLIDCQGKFHRGTIRLYVIVCNLSLLFGCTVLHILNPFTSFSFSSHSKSSLVFLVLCRVFIKSFAIILHEY